jgi:hypothetical protein
MVAPPTTSLLPPPKAPVGSIEALYALMSEASSTQQKAGKAEAESKFVAKRAALEEYRQKLKDAEEDAKSGNLFKTVATVAMVVVAAAATVMTLGTATPLVVAVGLGLSASGFLVSETKCLDGLLGDGVSSWVGLGMTVCGAVVTGFAPSGSSTLEAAARGAQGASAMCQGLQKGNDVAHAYNADRDMRGAKVAEHNMQRLQRAIDDVIAQLQDSTASSRRASQTANTIIETQGQTLIFAAGGTR